MSITNNIISFFLIGLGICYIINIYDIYELCNDFSKLEVQQWGVASIILGIINLMIFIISYISKKQLHILKIVHIALIGLIQIIPIVLWIHSGEAYGSWLYSIPHIMLFLFAAIYIILLIKKILKNKETIQNNILFLLIYGLIILILAKILGWAVPIAVILISIAIALPKKEEI